MSHFEPELKILSKLTKCSRICPLSNGGGEMTQLVGAICDGGKKVITVSDRMVSTADMTLTFEQPRMKVEVISGKAVVLAAGTIHEPDLIRQAKESAKGKDKILEVAEELKKAFQEIREKHVTDEVLRPRGIHSFAEWHQKQRGMHDHIVMTLNEEINKYQLELSLLLAGMDSEGHLILIGDPGMYRSFDNLCYCCLGIGQRHSANVFAYQRYTRDLPLNDTIYIAFEAKKRAEMAGGVGQATDIIIIDNEGIYQIGEETIRQLEKIYDERESKAERRGFGKEITELEIRKHKMES